RADVAGTPRTWAAAGAGALAIAAIIALLLPTSVPRGASAQVTLTGVRSAPDLQVQATIRVHPATLARGADWFNVIAWQGHGKLVLDRLRRIGDGIYRTTKPIPADGSWKVGLRFHRGDRMASIPIYMPVDRAIPVAGVPASARFDRPFVADHKILQRERKQNVAGWVWGVAGAVVLACCTALLLLLGWAIARLARGGPTARTRPERLPIRARAASGA
ncbi:MAG: hypothetical protein JWN32_857, partial [Solirubrobacterales bacterium]|nr:hypothetical protein [Solirubrobacterales bacterium]